MATASDIRQRVLNYVYGAYHTDRPFETQLTGSYTAGGTSITVTDGTDWEEGDIVENALTGEQMRVQSVSTNTLTVERSYNSTAAAASDGTTDRLKKNPRISIAQIDTAIKHALNNMGSWGIHSFGTGSLTLVASQYGYEITDTDVDETYGVLAIYYSDTTTEQPIAVPFRQSVQLSTAIADWTAGHVVTLLSKGDRAAGDDLYYTYARSLVFDTNLDTTLAKLLAPQEEVIVLSAASEVIGETIIPATHDPGARTDRTTPPGQTSRDGRWFQGEFFIKARAEAARVAVLRQQVPGTVRTRRAKRWRS